MTFNTQTFCSRLAVYYFAVSSVVAKQKVYIRVYTAITLRSTFTIARL